MNESGLYLIIWTINIDPTQNNTVFNTGLTSSQISNPRMVNSLRGSYAASKIYNFTTNNNQIYLVNSGAAAANLVTINNVSAAQMTIVKIANEPSV